MSAVASDRTASNESIARRLATVLVFPLVFGGAIAGATALLATGMTRTWVIPIVIGSAAAVVIVLERLHPHVPAWNRPRGDVRTDVLHGIVSLGITPELFRAATFTALFAASAALSGWLGSDLWPAHWPLAVQLVAAMVISEFGSYWTHRLMHEVPLLWRLHATHHTAERLYWLNAVRFHPLDTLLSYAGQSIPLVLLGVPEAVLALFAVWTGIHGMFQHANVRMKLGPLNWFFSMAELHRWHHSKLPREGNSNYGSNVIVWDVIFGTRFLPADREPPEEIGVGNLPHFPKGYLAQLASPFRWAAVERQSARSPDVRAST